MAMPLTEVKEYYWMHHKGMLSDTTTNDYLATAEAVIAEQTS